MLNMQRAFFFAAIMFFAASVMSSLAHAHGGHAHSTPTVGEDSHALARNPTIQHAAAEPSIVKLANPVLQSRAVPVRTGCADHCCGGANSMSCCGTALPPQICFVPFFETQTVFIIRDMPVPTGIPP